MALQKRLTIKRDRYENHLRALINAMAVKLGYSYNNENVFLWGDEMVIGKIRQLAEADISM